MRPITAEEEYSKNSELKREDVEYLRQWMYSQPHLPRGVTDQQLILFLYCSRNNLEDSKKVIEAYYTIRTHFPAIFDNRDPKGDDVQSALSTVDICQLPKTDQHGNHIMAVRINNPDTSRFTHRDLLKTYFMSLDAFMVENGTVPGYVFVIDMEPCGVGHLAKINVSYMKLLAEYIQDGLPGNAVAIHVVNANTITKAIFLLMKPFLRGVMSKKLYIHTSVDTLYEHITKDALPEDYGGNLASIETYHKLSVEQLERCRNWFREEATLRVDESKSQGKH